VATAGPRQVLVNGADLVGRYEPQQRLSGREEHVVLGAWGDAAEGHVLQRMRSLPGWGARNTDDAPTNQPQLDLLAVDDAGTGGARLGKTSTPKRCRPNQAGELGRLDSADNEPELLSRLADRFLTRAPTDLASLRAAVERGDVVAMVQVAHRLKGAAATLGSAGMVDLCQELGRLPVPARCRPHPGCLAAWRRSSAG
jgi:Hpt domain-containing protein